MRFGQTEVGSYIVNVISPLNQKNIIQDEIVTSSFSRLVTQTLAKSLNALNSIESQINDLNEDQILNNSNHNDIFERIVDKGVSSNLCDALIGLTGVDKNRGFEITLMASEIIPHENDINVSIHFSSNIVSLLEKASNYYKENYVITGVTLTGQIKKLEREANKENGSVTIQTIVSGNKKNVSFELNSEEYVYAIHAHENKEEVSCSGDLHITPRSAKLLNSYGFNVHSNNSRLLFEF